MSTDLTTYMTYDMTSVVVVYYKPVEMYLHLSSIIIILDNNLQLLCAHRAISLKTCKRSKRAKESGHIIHLHAIAVESELNFGKPVCGRAIYLNEYKLR